ncbi:unnamed protein product [Lathyrus oleraceus]
MPETVRQMHPDLRSGIEKSNPNRNRYLRSKYYLVCGIVETTQIAFGIQPNRNRNNQITARIWKKNSPTFELRHGGANR